MSDLINRLDAEEDAMIDDYLALFWRLSPSILEKIKEKDGMLFAVVMSEMVNTYVDVI